MLLTLESSGLAGTQPAPELAVLEADPATWAEIAAALQSRGYLARRYSDPVEIAADLRNHPPRLVILSTGIRKADRANVEKLRKLVRDLGIPVLDVIDPGEEAELIARHGSADGWVFRSRLEAEMPARVELLLQRHGPDASARAGGMLPNDSRFFPLIVHDLRTPLNVIGLSLRMIDQALPRGNAELEEDFRFVEENFKQIERMLSQLSDYCRLFESEFAMAPTEFSPQRLLSEVLEDRPLKGEARNAPVHLEVQATCPPQVELDPTRARLALQYALRNAVAASNGQGVRVDAGGRGDRWITQFVVESSPPSSVKSTELRPQLFERLCGTAAERRGMDLAITARISEMFGGHARLEVIEDRSTSIILDWPVRIAAT